MGDIEFQNGKREGKNTVKFKSSVSLKFIRGYKKSVSESLVAELKKYISE